jgi:dTDP-L-rhamnose 4-epimerase
MHPPRLGSVLVTGGAGFIGSALSQELVPHSDRWVVLDNLHPQIHPSRQRPEALHASAELVIGDASSSDDWDSVLTQVRPDVVFHLAAETGTAQSLNEATRHASVNVVGTTEMLDALSRAAHVPQHFILTSSRAVYGEGSWERRDGSVFTPGQRTHAQLASAQWDFDDATAVSSESRRTVPAPTSVYGATKLAQEHILRAWTNSRDTGLTVLRLQNVYGPGQSLINSYTGIVSLFSQWAREGKTIPVFEDGHIVRDFVFISDVVDALVAASRRQPSAVDAPFDIGIGGKSTILDAAAFIASYYNAPSPEVTGAFRDGDVRHASCDIERSKAELSWSPQWPVERGLAALQEWIGAQIEAGQPHIAQ